MLDLVNSANEQSDRPPTLPPHGWLHDERTPPSAPDTQRPSMTSRRRLYPTFHCLARDTSWWPPGLLDHRQGSDGRRSWCRSTVHRPSQFHVGCCCHANPGPRQWICDWSVRQSGRAIGNGELRRREHVHVHGASACQRSARLDGHEPKRDLLYTGKRNHCTMTAISLRSSPV
jgi:hypothetical protein